jgi:hypothetical protein
VERSDRREPDQVWKADFFGTGLTKRLLPLGLMNGLCEIEIPICQRECRMHVKGLCPGVRG